MASANLTGGVDRIRILLFITTVIFLILSIVFIILFATKHDSSSAYLTSGFSTKAASDVQSELDSVLKKSYTVNSLAVDVKSGIASAVFSLRGNPGVVQVQDKLNALTTIVQPTVSNGDNSYAVCHPVPQLPTKSTAGTNPTPLPTSAATQPPKTSTVVVPPNIYCDVPIIRDVAIIIDMNENTKYPTKDKLAALNAIKTQLDANVDFSVTRVSVQAYANTDVNTMTGAFVNNQADFDANFQAALTAVGTKTSSLPLSAVFAAAMKMFPSRKSVAQQLVIITDKANSGNGAVNPRDMGLYVTLIGVNSNYVVTFKSAVDQTLAYDAWDKMATDEPFGNVLCTFFNPPPPAPAANFELAAKRDDVPSTPQCETIDLIIAFDTSESLSRIILPRYQDFAKRFLKQYKYSGNDFTRVGIIEFNENIDERLSLTNGVTYDIVNGVITNVVYTGGLTNVNDALRKAKDMFTTEGVAASDRGRVLLVLSDGIPTVGTPADEIAAGKELSAIGVATFFVGYAGFSDDTFKQLSQVTDPNNIIPDLSDPSLIDVTNKILAINPCPQPKCVTAYYAMEISEATWNDVVKHLQHVLVSSTASAKSQPTASFQLATYNSGNTQFNPPGDSSLPKFQAFVQSLIDDQQKRMTFRGGKTRLDLAMNDITNELVQQSAKNRLFSSTIIFYGEANFAVLDPTTDTEAEKKASLDTAAKALKLRTPLVYVVDDSRDPVNFGDDLWTTVTTQQRIVASSSADIDAALKATDYYNQWGLLTCSLPPLATCLDTPLDVAVMFDMSKQDEPFINYVAEFVSQFETINDVHVSMLAYGMRPTRVLSQLATHTADELSAVNETYEDWRDGSLFTTTVSTTITTTLPTTTAVKSSTAAPVPPELNAVQTLNDYTVNTDTINDVFTALKTQFGCGNYDESKDRLFAPNVYIIASDNFAAYSDAVWQSFRDNVRNTYGCWDCAGTPRFYFFSRAPFASNPPASIGVTINLSDADLDVDPTDNTSTLGSITKFNGIVSNICTTPLNQCVSYDCFNRDEF